MYTKIFTLFTTLCILLNVNAQEIYFNSGKNYTKYYYSKIVDNPDYLINNSNRISDVGNSYGVGVLFNRENASVVYGVGISYNEYNITYAISDSNIKYSWQTKYLGIENHINISLLETDDRSWCDCSGGQFKIDARLGINAAAYIYGYENASNINVNLTNSSDYRKIIIQPYIGINMSYPLSGISALNLGYIISIANVARDQGNSFNLINNNIYVGINIKL